MKKNILFNRNYSLLIAGNAVSRIGNVIFDIAIVWWILDKTGNIKYSSYIMAASMLAVAILSPISGVLSDRLNKKYVLVITDFISGFFVVTVSIMAYFDIINIIFLTISSFVLGICSSLFRPTIKSIIPSIVSKEVLVKANSFSSNIAELAKIAGPMFASFLISVTFIGIPGALLVNGITFILSACFEMFIKYESVQRKRENVNVLLEIKEGFSYVYGKKVILKLIAISSLANVFFAGFNIILPLYVKDVLKASSDVYSYALIAEAIGGVIITLILLMLNNHLPTIPKLYFTMSLSGISLAMVSISGNYGIFFISIVGIGLFLGWFNSLFFSYVQMKVDEEYIGRTFSIVYMLAVSVMPISYLIFGAIGSSVIDYVFPVCGLLIVIISIPLLKVIKTEMHEEAVG